MTKQANVSSVLVCLLLVACSSDKADPEKTPSGGGIDSPDASTDVTPPSDSDEFLTDYAAAVCAMYEPCCKAEGQGYDASGCTTWFSKVTSAYFRGDYAADAASSCLSKLADVRAADEQRCANVLDFDLATLRSECQRAFGGSARDGSALGEKCLLAGDCARSSGETVICYGSTCVRQRSGDAGDGPCYAGGRTGLPHELVVCEAANGLYCERENNVCAAQVEDGQTCATAAACKATSRCIGGRCQTLPGPGEACLNGIAGAGGFCRPGSACNRITLICSSPLAEGETCREPAECASGSCMANKCTKPAFTRALNCTGG